MNCSTFSKSIRGAIMETNCSRETFPCVAFCFACFPLSFSMAGAVRCSRITVCSVCVCVFHCLAATGMKMEFSHRRRKERVAF